MVEDYACYILHLIFTKNSTFTIVLEMKFFAVVLFVVLALCMAVNAQGPDGPHIDPVPEILTIAPPLQVECNDKFLYKM